MKINFKIILLAIVIFTIASFFSKGHNHPDEYFQILEFVAYKINLASINRMPWEFFAKMRPSLQIYIVLFIYKFYCYFFTFNPFYITFILRFIMAILSIVSILLLIKSFNESINNEKYFNFLILIALFSWIVIFNDVRFSSENFSSKIFIIALSILLLNKKNNLFLVLLSGILLGIAFTTRFQIAFMIIGLFFWLLFINRISVKNITLLLLGFLLSIAIFNLYLDYHFYDGITVTAYNYFKENIINNKVNTFDTYSVLFYLLFVFFLPFGPLYVFSLFFFTWFFPKNVITWIIVPFLIVHLLIPHKELRFLLPILDFMPIITVFTLIKLKDTYNFDLLNYTKLIKYSWIINCIILIVIIFIPASTQIYLCEKIFYSYKKDGVFYYLNNMGEGHLLDFYKRKNMELKGIDNINELHCIEYKNCLVALKCISIQEMHINNKNWKLVYNNCPNWIYNYEFIYKWLFNVYEIKSIE